MCHRGDTWWRFQVWVIAHTGLRRSEVLALRWSDIDLDNQRIKILRAPDTGNPAAPRGETKGTKSDHPRVVDIDAATAKIIRQRRSGRASLSLELAQADTYVFGSLDGTPRNPNALSQMFTRLGHTTFTTTMEHLPHVTLTMQWSAVDCFAAVVRGRGQEA